MATRPLRYDSRAGVRTLHIGFEYALIPLPLTVLLCTFSDDWRPGL
jgi:hypothetical protein